jgi:DNA repair protein RadC
MGPSPVQSPPARSVHESAPRLADVDLLARLLGPVRRRSPRACAEVLLARGLRHLSTRSRTELRQIAGVGERQASRLEALFLLARRLMQERLDPGMQFASPRQIYEHYHAVLRDRKREMFLVILLDARHRIMREEIVSEGSLTSSIVHPREVFMPAVRESAGAIVFVHNHPSGDPQPSDEDIAVTRRLVHAADLLGIRVLDHVIVGDGTYASFKEAGLL